MPVSEYAKTRATTSMSILQEALGDLRKRTRRCLGFLSKKGLPVVAHDGTQIPLKQGSYRDVTGADRAVRLHNGEIIWLRADAPREDLDQEYRGIEVFDETPQTDKAIIAALTALETGRTESEGLEKAILIYKLGAGIHAKATPGSEAPEKAFGRWLMRWAGKVREASQSEPELQEVTHRDSNNALAYMYTFGYAEELLRYYRSNYDELNRREQAALIQGACRRINKFHEALEELVAFAEYETYDAEKGKLRKLKSATENVQLQVDAALLRAVEGLKDKEIGARLGARTPSAEEWKKKRDASTPRAWVKKGHDLVKAAWGEEGWTAYVAAKKAERGRWRTLSEEDRLFEARVEQIAAFAGVPVEEALRIIETGEPDEGKDGIAYIWEAFDRGAEKLLKQDQE